MSNTYEVETVLPVMLHVSADNVQEVIAAWTGKTLADLLAAGASAPKLAVYDPAADVYYPL